MNSADSLQFMKDVAIIDKSSVPLAFSLFPKGVSVKSALNYSRDSADDSNFSINNDTPLGSERRNSVISSIDVKSISKRQNEDSFFSYLKSESSHCKSKVILNQDNYNKKLNNDDQLELVNFIPGALLKKKEKSQSDDSPNQSSESINAKKNIYSIEDQANVSKSVIELIDSKTLEAKNHLIFDKYIKQFSTSQSRDKEDNNSSYDLIQNMCLPKGLICSDSNQKDLSALTNKTVDKPAEVESEMKYDKTGWSGSLLDQQNYSNIYNNIHINNYTFQPYLSNNGYYPQVQSMMPNYPHVLPGAYIPYSYPGQQMPYSYSIDNGSHYQVPYGNNMIYQNPAYSSNFPGNKAIPLVQQQVIRNTNDSSVQRQTFPQELKLDLNLNIVKAVRDQNECRNLQIQLEKDPSLSHRILPQLLQYFVVFCSDPFGNYLVQKVLEYLYEEEFDPVVAIIIENFNEMSLHNFGTRVIQKFIEVGSHNQLNKLSVPIRENMFSLYKSQNGIHVITKFVSKCRTPEFVFEFIYNNISAVSKNKEGCCMIQKILEITTPDQKLPLIKSIASHCLEFIVDKHASYVLQMAVQIGPQSLVVEIVNLFCANGRLKHFCKHQYSSNVIEKCLDGNNKIVHDIIVSALLKNPELIGELLIDLNGNYVVQKALPVSKGTYFIEILTKISENFQLLQTVSFGSKLSAKLLGMYPELKSIRHQNSRKSSKQIVAKGTQNYINNPQLNKQERQNLQSQTGWSQPNSEVNQKFSITQSHKVSNFK